MVVIRWRDIFESLEAAVDACETVAHVLEGIGLRRRAERRRSGGARARVRRARIAQRRAETAVGTRGSLDLCEARVERDQRGAESAKPPVNAADAASACGLDGRGERDHDLAADGASC